MAPSFVCHLLDQNLVSKILFIPTWADMTKVGFFISSTTMMDVWLMIWNWLCFELVFFFLSMFLFLFLYRFVLVLLFSWS